MNKIKNEKLEMAVIDIAMEIYENRIGKGDKHPNYDKLFKRFDKACSELYANEIKEKVNGNISSVRDTLSKWKETPRLANVSDLPDLIKKLEVALANE